MGAKLLDDLDKLAEDGDVSYGIHSYLLRFPDPEGRARATEILNKGRRSAALSWLKSASSGGSPTATKAECLRKAKVFAHLADLDIETLAKENNLEHLIK